MATTDRDGPSSPSAADDVPTLGPESVDPAAVALDQTFDSDSLYALRSAVAAHGAHLGLAERQLEDLVLVAHELASNAIRHGGASTATPARLRLWHEHGLVVCEVSDSGPGMTEPTGAGLRPVPLTASSGRGLWIIRQVVDRFGITTGPTGTTVTLAFSLDGHGASDVPSLP
jgi:anti-sigma regulatory factor (Ser/Thr protein kinase)